MENSQSPLRQFQRQPKLYIDLPSNGIWYNENIVADGTSSSLAVFSMTANDEIGFKTPDALINGEATAKNIKSCIPAILDPWNIRTADIDSILIAIRMATYGQNMSVANVCSKCGEENAYDVDLQKYLNYYATKTYDDTINYENFVVKLHPLTYRQWTDIQKKQTGFQRALTLQIPKITDEEQKEQAIQSIIDQINELTVISILDQVKSIQIEDHIETDKKEIVDFLNNQDVKFFHMIKDLVEQNILEWTLPTEDIKCEKCNHEETLKVSLDQSNFFVAG
jgi:hypothetical protein